jgi:hypothetical protein
MIEFLTALEQAVKELRQFVIAYDDAVTMPGRRRPGVDADGTGRQATHGPSRPVEALALDESRAELLAQLKSGAAQLPYAIAVVSGVSASMDRALARWEGEDDSRVPGGTL